MQILGSKLFPGIITFGTVSSILWYNSGENNVLYLAYLDLLAFC